MDVAVWLHSIGLERYEGNFARNSIDTDLLLLLTEADLRDLGVQSVGHRRKLIAEIDALRRRGPRRRAPADQTATTDALPEDQIRDEPAEHRGPERRHLTILFADLEASTSLSTCLDPEDFRDYLYTFQNTASDEVTKHGGYVAKFMGDGVLAYFGWPRASEDQTSCAVRAGLAIATAVSRLALPGGRHMAVRVGLASGVVVVGDEIGALAAHEMTVVGAAPNLAARLQSSARPGEVVISEETRSLLGQGFDCEPIGPFDLKGFADPVLAFVVHREAPVRDRFEVGHPGPLFPMVGRDEELRLLLAKWRAAVAREGNAVLIVGQAGIGKSRLVNAIADEIRGRNATILRYQCSPHHAATPLWPIVRQIEFAAELASAANDLDRLRRLEQLFQQGSKTASEAVALLAPYFSISACTCYSAPMRDARRLRARTLAVLVEQLQGLARHRPVLMLVEDAHWIDPTTVELMRACLESIDEARVLMLLTSRPESRPDLGESTHLTQVTLGKLDRGSIGRIVEQLAGERSIPAKVREEITARTEGVPLYAEELARAVLVSGADLAAVPVSLHASLMARLDAAGEARPIAQVAACAGRTVSHRLLANISPFQGRAFEQALGRLIASGLLVRRGVPPEASYSFRHALLRDAAHQSLLRRTRTGVHQRIARILMEDATAEPELIALHCEEACLEAEAVEYWRRAGERSAARHANLEAAAHFARAIALVRKRDECEERDRLEADLLLAQVVPLIPTHGFGSEVVETCAVKAAEVGRRAPSWTGQFGADRVVWNSCLMRKPVPRSLELARRLLESAAGGDDPAQMAIASRALGYTLFIAGEQDEADRHLQRGAELADTLSDKAFVLYGEHPGVVCRIYLGSVRCLRGFPDTGAEVSDEGVARARSAGNPHMLAWALVCAGNVRMFGGRAADAISLAREAIEVSEENALPQWRAFSEEIIGWALCRLGEPEEGLSTLRESLKRLHATGAMLHTHRMHCLLAEGNLLADRPETAMHHIKLGLDHCEFYGERYLQAELLRLEAVVLRAGASQSERVMEKLEEARGVARRQAAKLLELRIANEIAGTMRMARPNEVRPFLQPLLNSFSEGMRWPDLHLAQGLISD